MCPALWDGQMSLVAGKMVQSESETLLMFWTHVSKHCCFDGNGFGVWFIGDISRSWRKDLESSIYSCLWSTSSAFWAHDMLKKSCLMCMSCEQRAATCVWDVSRVVSCVCMWTKSHLMCMTCEQRVDSCVCQHGWGYNTMSYLPSWMKYLYNEDESKNLLL